MPVVKIILFLKLKSNFYFIFLEIKDTFLFFVKFNFIKTK